MREILFKAKRLDNGEWAEGYLVKYPSAIQVGDCSPWYIQVPPVDPDDSGGKYNVDPSTVCEYTGLTDKNGKKIFEGDIIKTTKYGLDDGKGHNFAGADIFTVVFADGGYCLYNKWRRFNLRPDVDIEICGSIHDGEGGKDE